MVHICFSSRTKFVELFKSLTNGFLEDRMVLALAYYDRHRRIKPEYTGAIKNSLEFLSSALDGLSLSCERVSLDEKIIKAYEDEEQFRRMMGVGPFYDKKVVSAKLTSLKETLQKIVNGKNISQQELEEVYKFYSKASRDELTRTEMIMGL